MNMAAKLPTARDGGHGGASSRLMGGMRTVSNRIAHGVSLQTDAQNVLVW